jgi:acyl-CoA synthetase (AMP-forming)/AMP-acid ligase II
LSGVGAREIIDPVPLSDSSIGAMLRHGARRHPAAPFLVDDQDGHTLTYAEVHDATNRVAQSLIARGARSRDRVTAVLPNGLPTVLLYLGALKMGAVFNPLNPGFTTDELDYLIESAEPRLLYASRETAGRLSSRRAERPVISVDDETASWLEGPAAPPASPDPEPDAAALLLYTSGSTGKPKGALLSHANLRTNAEQIAAWLALGPHDRMLCVMPLFHANALVLGVLAPLTSGASVVICAHFSATRFWSTVERHQPTVFGSVATMLEMILARGGAPSPSDRHRLRLALCGSAPVPPELIRRFQHAAGIPVIEGYGLTECTCRATFNPVHAPRIGSAGVSIGTEIGIRAEDDTNCPPNVTGEIVLRGPTLMTEYFRDAPATAHVLRNGWLHTGDLGYLTADGYLYIVGRQSDMIIRGGENIYPREIEDVLHRLPGVREAAVVGLPDPRYGERVVAALVVDPAQAITTAEVVAHCARHLVAFKCPTRVCFVDALPRNATGKVSKRHLRDHLAIVSSTSIT